MGPFWWVIQVSFMVSFFSYGGDGTYRLMCAFFWLNAVWMFVFGWAAYNTIEQNETIELFCKLTRYIDRYQNLSTLAFLFWAHFVAGLFFVCRAEWAAALPQPFILAGLLVTSALRAAILQERRA